MTTVESLIDFGEVADSGADDHYDVLPPSGGHSNYDLLGEIDDSHRSFGDVGEDDEVEETYSEDDGGQDYLREGSPIQESNHVYERADDVQHFHEEADFVDVRNSEAADDKSSESDSDHSEASLPGDNLDEFDPLRSTMSETATTAKTTTTKTRRAKKVVSKKKAVSVSSRGSSTSDVSDGGEKKYEAQFGDTPEDVTVNGTEQDLNAQEDATYAYSADAGQQQTAEGQHGSGSSGAADKKAMEYMKERYETQPGEAKPKLIREPKKLTQQWPQTQSADGDSGRSDARKGFTTEQELLTYSRPGLEHTKAQYESKATRIHEPSSPLSPVSPLSQGHLSRWDGVSSQNQVPVNRQVIEKVAPPQITQNVRAMFESGAIPDLHEVKKTRVADEKLPESGVYENEPEQRNDILRETDQLEESFQLGQTRSIVQDWGSQGAPQTPRAPIQLAEDDGAVVENEPAVLTGVLRETDQDYNQGLPSRGHAHAILNRWGSVDEDRPQRDIQLVENPDQVGPAVCENTPLVRSDVVRGDDMDEDVMFDQGRTRNLAGFWATRTDDGANVRRTRIEIAAEDAGPSILENQPMVREDLVREADGGDEIVLERGHIRNVASRWQGEQETFQKRSPFKMDLSDAPSVIENEPSRLDDHVVTGNQYQSDVIVSSGQIRNIADRFNRPSEERSYSRVPDMITLDQSSEPTVVENQPAPRRQDIVRSDSAYADDLAEVTTSSTRAKLDRWRSIEVDGVDSTVSSRSGKPSWVLEIEQSSEPSVYENTPIQMREDVVREMDYNEAPNLIPDRHTRRMNTMWAGRDASIEAASQKTSMPQVRRPPPSSRRVLTRNQPEPPPPTAPKPAAKPPTPTETKAEMRRKSGGFKFRNDWQKRK